MALVLKRGSKETVVILHPFFLRKLRTPASYSKRRQQHGSARCKLDSSSCGIGGVALKHRAYFFAAKVFGMAGIAGGGCGGCGGGSGVGLFSGCVDVLESLEFASSQTAPAAKRRESGTERPPFGARTWTAMLERCARRWRVGGSVPSCCILLSSWLRSKPRPERESPRPHGPRGLNIPGYDTRCYFNVRSKADISQLNLPHETDN